MDGEVSDARGAHTQPEHSGSRRPNPPSRFWGGASVEEICRALGIRVADLFYESRSNSNPHVRVAHTLVQPVQIEWRVYSHQILWFSEELFLRGERVLSTARGLSPSTLTEEELEIALNAIYQAHLDLDESSRLEDLAVNLRDFGIQEEKTNHAARQSAA